jgi:hypothetical protein
MVRTVYHHGMRLVLLVVLLAHTAHADAPRLPAHYAKLFQQGATWTYDIAVTGWDHDKLQAMEARGINIHKLASSRWPRRTDRRQLKCKVDRVATYASSIVSEVSCDQDAPPMITIPGVFFATAKGLYRLADFPTKEPSPLDDGEVEIAAAPKVFRTETQIEKQQGGGKTVVGIRIENGAWCKYDELIGNYAGHNGKGSTCYGRGLLLSIAHDFGPDLRDIKIRAR